MKIFVLGVDHGTGERGTLESIAFEMKEIEIILVPAGHIRTVNEVIAVTEDVFCMTIRAGSIILPGFMASLDGLIGEIESAGLAWMHLRTAEDSGSLQAKFRPGEPGPVLWNIGLMREGKLTFPETGELPFDWLVEWELMHKLSLIAPGRTVAAPHWSPSNRKWKDWKRKAEEWAKLAPLVCPAGNVPGSLTEKAIPELTIVMAAYNAADYIPWAVKSIQRQTASEWQLILVDDGSTDESPRMMNKWAEEDPLRIQVVRIEPNRGKAAALNEALPLVRAPWLLELDADDWLDPDCVKEMAHKLQSVEKDTVLVYGNHTVWRQDQAAHISLRDEQNYPEELNMKQMLASGVPLAPRIYRTERLRSLGGWRTDDPAAGRLYEDMLMIIRILQTGKPFFVDGCYYHRRVRANSITRMHQDQYTQWCQWVEEAYLQ